METISVIITTKNDEENLINCLKAIRSEREALLEVIVVDGDGSPNLKRRKIFKDKLFKYVDGRGTNLCEGRNLGLHHVNGTIVAFIDSDTMVCPGWADALLKTIWDKDIVAGFIHDGKGGHRMNRVSCFVNGNDITYAGCNIAYKTEVIDTIGFFDPRLKSADDLDYNLRCVQAGFNITYEPTMQLIHYHRQSLFKWMKQQFIYGYGRYQFNQKHGKLKHETGSFKNVFRLAFGAGGYILGRYLYKKG